MPKLLPSSFSKLKLLNPPSIAKNSYRSVYRDVTPRLVKKISKVVIKTKPLIKPVGKDFTAKNISPLRISKQSVPVQKKTTKKGVFSTKK